MFTRCLSSTFPAPQTPCHLEEREGTSKEITKEYLSVQPLLRVLLIRHAESVNNRLYKELCDSGRARLWDEWRHADPPLTEEGWQQAEQLATRLERNPELYDFDGRGMSISKIYTSAMHRAMQTALPLHRYLKTPTEIWPSIHETGGIFHVKQGILRGHTFNQIGVEFAGFHVPRETVGERGWWRGGSETYAQMVERADTTKLSLFDMAQDIDEDTTIALVSHGSFLSALIRSLTQANCAFALMNTAVTCVDITVDSSMDSGDDIARVRLHYVNCLDRP